MGKIIMRVEGMDGQVELMTDRVVIYHRGLWNMLKFGLNTRHEIPIGALTEISFKDATRFTFGQIEFLRGGHTAPNGQKKANPNAVRFKRDKQAKFEALKEKLFEMVNQHAKTHR